MSCKVFRVTQTFALETLQFLPNVKMPNRNGFIWIDPRPDTMAKPCMRACADPSDVRITSTAEGRNLTPRTTGPLDTMQPK